jgi:hypothetical protein
LPPPTARDGAWGDACLLTRELPLRLPGAAHARLELHIVRRHASQVNIAKVERKAELFREWRDINRDPVARSCARGTDAEPDGDGTSAPVRQMIRRQHHLTVAAVRYRGHHATVTDVHRLLQARHRMCGGWGCAIRAMVGQNEKRFRCHSAYLVYVSVRQSSTASTRWARSACRTRPNYRTMGRSRRYSPAPGAFASRAPRSRNQRQNKPQCSKDFGTTQRQHPLPPVQEL